MLSRAESRTGRFIAQSIDSRALLLARSATAIRSSKASRRPASQRHGVFVPLGSLPLASTLSYGSTSSQAPTTPAVIDASFVKQQLERARKQYALDQLALASASTKRGVSDQSEWELVVENNQYVFKRCPPS